MARKAISLILLILLMLSTMTSALAAENVVTQETHVHDETASPTDPHDHDEPQPTAEQDTPEPTEKPDTEPLLPDGEGIEGMPAEGALGEQDVPAYTVLMGRSGVGLGIIGSVEDSKPGIVPFLVGSRPCLFEGCPNSVTVTSKYCFVCNAHKCSVAGCPWVLYYSNPNRCQVHAGITNITCQVVEPEKYVGLCGKPSVGNGSPCCWEHHCPGCFGIGNGNGTLCDLCKQCWVPGCPNLSTCTNECNTHCPHTCKTHHANHCTSCHADPCVCYPDDPVIVVKAWNSADNTVAVEISSARATQIELYTAAGVKFATLTGASGTYTFRYNGMQNNGSYYVRVKNTKGYNSSNFPFSVSALDVAPPVITGKTVQPDGSVWATSKTLTITATDKTNATFSLRYADGSPVPGCPDKAGSVSGAIFTAAWVLTEQIASAKTFKIIASDRWGFSSETTVTISGIDGIKPNKPTVLLSNGDGWHKEAVTVTISGSSADSGIAYYQYRVDGGTWQIGNTVQVASEGIHAVEAKAISGAGLESDVANATVKIDKTKPTASYTLSHEGWTTENVTIFFTPSDSGGSGLASLTLPDGRTVYDFSQIQFLATQNGDYRFTISDVAGNSAVITTPVSNIALLDVTVTLNAPFVISPDSNKLYSGEIFFENNSNVPVAVMLQRMIPYDGAPELVGKDTKVWEALTAAETKRYLALGFIGNGVDFWVDGYPHSFGVIDKGGVTNFTLQGRFGYAWEQTETFLYCMTLNIAIAG